MISRCALLTSLILVITIPTFAQQETQRQPLEPGVEAPEFTATTLEDVSITLAQWDGRVVVLNYFITWYRDAADHLGMMEDLQTLYSRDGMRLLSISLDDGERGVEQVRELVREQELAHPVVIDADQEVAELYGVRALPAIFVIGRNGEIAYYHEGYTEGDERRLSQAIATALGVECATPEPQEDVEADEAGTQEPEEPVCDCFRRREE